MRIKRKLNVLYDLCISYLSMLSIRSKKIYVFGSWGGNTFSDNPKYLYLEAHQNKNLKAIWVTKNPDIYQSLRSRGYRVYMYKSLGGIFYQLRASVYFTCMSRFDVYTLIMGNATRVNLWHGVGLKKILHDDKITNRSNHQKQPSAAKKIWSRIERYPKRKEYIVTTSDIMTDIFMNAFRKSKDRFLQFGQPRNDVFFREDLEFEPFRLKGNHQKLILYMPTHRNEGKAHMHLNKILNLSLLNDFCAAHNILFVVKKHYYHNAETENLAPYAYIKDITRNHFDAQQLLKHTDILITDYSSCFVDFLLLDRPVIFYNYDYQEYVLNDRDLYFEYDATTPGEKAQNFEALFAALRNIIVDKSDPFKEQREAVKQIFYAPENQKEVGTKILNFVREKLV